MLTIQFFMKNKQIQSGRSERVKLYTVHEGVNRIVYVADTVVKLTLLVTALSIMHADVHISVRLKRPGADVRIIGIVFGQEQSEIHFHTVQIHESRETVSNLLVKSVLQDDARFYYEGNIRIEKNADKSDAYQRNENLLLGTSSRVTSHPSLEILANDVRCTHGAATGPLPEEQLWYLESRGISSRIAKTLYIEGFLSSAFHGVTDSSIVSTIWQKIQPAI
jgi:Fe-S cluster assembly protein SufD